MTPTTAAPLLAALAGIACLLKLRVALAALVVALVVVLIRGA